MKRADTTSENERNGVIDLIAYINTYVFDGDL